MPPYGPASRICSLIWSDVNSSKATVLDACRQTIVTVDLIRRMGIQEGIQDAVPVARDHAADQLVCIFAVPGARPHVQLMRLGPSGSGRTDFPGGAALIADLQRTDRRFRLPRNSGYRFPRDRLPALFRSWSLHTTL